MIVGLLLIIVFDCCISYLGRRVKSQHQMEEIHQIHQKMSHLSDCDLLDWGSAGHYQKMDHCQMDLLERKGRGKRQGWWRAANTEQGTKWSKNSVKNREDCV